MNIEELDRLKEISLRRINNVELGYVRKIYGDIEWSSRLILLKGCRGVGKTYLLLQYLKKARSESVYLSLDNLFFLDTKLTDVIDTFYKSGIKLFALDEGHKYPDWSIELKNIYDDYPDIRLIIASSSALNILAGSGDLSRRLDVYLMKGLSFDEYYELETGEKLPVFTFDEILRKHEFIHDQYYVSFDIGRRFSAYLKKGYYPIYKEAGSKYHDRLLAEILQVIDVDMAAIFNIDYESARQIKRLLALISRLGPFTPNVSKMARDLSMSRNSVLKYIDYLSEAGIINILKSDSKSDSVMTKPDKIFLENTNLLYAFDADLVNTGTLRETFVYNALSESHSISTPFRGDFLFDGKYAIEVGGPNKDFHQLFGMPNAVLVKEGIARGAPDVMPMWMLGLLL